jgi:hypothetical protein
MDADLERWKRWTKELNWHKIAWWHHRDLCRLGIDTINLLCALGLPGAEKMDIDHCLRKIDEWTDTVRTYTAKMRYLFEREPSRFSHSLAYFKALCLITALQRDCGVRYNQRIRDLSVPLEVADSFIFGIIRGDGGSCASLPVLYCAVGHQLGYPMSLVRAKVHQAGHLFVRWDDGKVRFNIEATAPGLTTPTDDYYRKSPYELTPEIEEKGCFLKPLNMRQSLAVFLAERSHHCMDQKAYQHAVDAMGWAAALHPENLCYLNTAKMHYNEWLTQWNPRKPPGFPEIIITEVERRRFAATVPFRFELEVCGLEATECLLKDKDHDRNLWEPMRRGERPACVPVEAHCKVNKDGGKTIRFKFQRTLNRDPGDFANV